LARAFVGRHASVLAANNLDLIPGQLEWSDDGKSLYFETGVKGELHLFRVDVPTKQSRRSLRARAPFATLISISPAENGLSRKRLQASRRSLHLDRERQERTQTDELERALWKQIQFADVERFTYKSATIGTSTAFL
jgi:dipeptidyl aminopeptidase/acylaminoacyl peptidase